jgi:lipoprotein-anchoring transpeptidase ErfK/SrfK
MRSKSFIAVTAVLVAMLATAAGVYAYDSGRKDLIAEGVRISGIDVGGLHADAARQRLSRAVLDPLAQPVVARYRDKTFTLTPEQARVGVNIDRSVGQAVERSRQGGMFARTWRGITGERTEADLPVDITYDQSAVKRLVHQVERQIERDPVNADVDLSGGNVRTKRSKDGLAVRAAQLRDQLSQLIVRPTTRRTVDIRTRRVEPDVSTKDLARKYPAIVIVNRSQFRLTLYKDLRPARTYRIAVGAAGLETPQGLYHVQNKAENPAWHVPDSDWAGKLAGKVIPADDPKNPIKARWMGIYDGAGIHGTDAVSSLGTAASHGCIRMAIPDVKELYDDVPVQSPVYII